MTPREPVAGAPALLVGIAGGSGSGKTSLARALVAALGGDRATLLAHDAYYRDGAARSPHARATANYDVPEAFDQALFLQHLAALRAGLPVRPPSTPSPFTGASATVSRSCPGPSS